MISTPFVLFRNLDDRFRGHYAKEAAVRTWRHDGVLNAKAGNIHDLKLLLFDPMFEIRVDFGDLRQIFRKL